MATAKTERKRVHIFRHSTSSINSPKKRKIESQTVEMKLKSPWMYGIRLFVRTTSPRIECRIIWPMKARSWLNRNGRTEILFILQFALFKIFSISPFHMDLFAIWLLSELWTFLLLSWYGGPQLYFITLISSEFLPVYKSSVFHLTYAIWMFRAFFGLEVGH